MDDTSEHSYDPTVDDLRVKLCYICREEERHDSPPHPPTVWTHPCKCTLVAHESCLLDWIKTQQRDLGRLRGDLKCPQCGELYEFEGFNPLVLRVLNSINRTLSRSGGVVTVCCVGTIIFSCGAGIYFTCASYGAFAVREFVGRDIFCALLTSNPTNWPLQAWFYLPMIPFSLIFSRTRLVWTTSPLLPLLFPWSSIASVSAVALGSRSIRSGPFASRPTLWPPPPALVCALYPVVRVLYGRLRDRITRMVMQDIIPTPTQAAPQRQEQQRRVQQGIQEQQPRGNQQERQQQLRIRLQARVQEQEQQPQRPQQQQQQQQMPAGHAAEHRFHFQFGLFGFELDHHFVIPPAPQDPDPAAAAVVEDAANGDDGRAVDQPVDQQQQLHRDGPVEEPEPDPEAVVPADQEPQQEQQQPPPEPQQEQEPQRQQWAEQGQGQEPVPPPLELDGDAFGAIAERAVRATGASFGRLIGGALLMPSIARMMGSVLLHISYVVPLMRTIIAPLPPPLPLPPPSLPLSGPIGTLLRVIRGARPDVVQVDHGHPRGWLSGKGLGAALLRGLFSTSQEWSTSDPVWWRNTLGLGIFLVVKDGLKLLHLWLAKRELKERHIINKSFAGIDLTGLDLVERQQPEA